MYKNKESKTLWVYAIILFACAAIVLLWTGYSQIKINNDLEEYQNRLNDKENENNMFQHNLSSAIAENDRLNEEINNLKNKLTAALNENESLKKEISDLEDNRSNTINVYEEVIKADIEYIEGNIKECAIILLEIDSKSIADKNLLIKYNDLVVKTYRDASELFYLEGYNNYKNKEYREAIENLNIALKLYDKEYYADDCYYFIAYSEYNTGNYSKAKEALNTIIDNYPNSSYYKDVKDLLKIIEKE
ncbi:tetratricopeptide repeat protein [Acetivibrio mesophilus]|uniref:Outer membrane protein assembly factor BamD n=1 Tax=Acetivibrio mesophilus TaxID=2487273 RepID=A0A4Q0I0S6_9FIRM|nr:tetratricopeptide repeat protein [Acetivibrio mesophilus]RXE57820.1 outer membrane protein assembly factor BamD [Acetivibrio mesophilus]